MMERGGDHQGSNFVLNVENLVKYIHRNEGLCRCLGAVIPGAVAYRTVL